MFRTADVGYNLYTVAALQLIQMLECHLSHQSDMAFLTVCDNNVTLHFKFLVAN
jgi:hypothetical protein